MLECYMNTFYTHSRSQVIGLALAGWGSLEWGFIAHQTTFKNSGNSVSNILEWWMKGRKSWCPFVSWCVCVCDNKHHHLVWLSLFSPDTQSLSDSTTKVREQPLHEQRTGSASPLPYVAETVMECTYLTKEVTRGNVALGMVHARPSTVLPQLRPSEGPYYHTVWRQQWPLTLPCDPEGDGCHGKQEQQQYAHKHNSLMRATGRFIMADWWKDSLLTCHWGWVLQV